jgi:hypothetical protein
VPVWLKGRDWRGTGNDNDAQIGVDLQGDLIADGEPLLDDLVDQKPETKIAIVYLGKMQSLVMTLDRIWDVSTGKH